MRSNSSIFLMNFAAWSFGSYQKVVASPSLSKRVRDSPNPRTTNSVSPNISKRVADTSWTPSRTSLFYDFPTATYTRTPAASSNIEGVPSLSTGVIVIIVIGSICGFFGLILLCVQCSKVSAALDAVHELDRVGRDMDRMTGEITERAGEPSSQQDHQELGGAGARQDVADADENHGLRVDLSDHEAPAERGDVERSPMEGFELYGGPPPAYESIGVPDAESDFDPLNLNNHESRRYRRV